MHCMLMHEAEAWRVGLRMMHKVMEACKSDADALMHCMLMHKAMTACMNVVGAHSDESVHELLVHKSDHVVQNC